MLTKRIKSLLWRLGGLVGVTVVGFFLQPEFIMALAESGIVVPAVVTSVGGLVLGEITKALNNK